MKNVESIQKQKANGFGGHYADMFKKSDEKGDKGKGKKKSFIEMLKKRRKR